MQYEYLIRGYTKTGKRKVRFKCVHCGQRNPLLEGYLYQARLHHSPRVHLRAACDEFVTQLNSLQLELFRKQRTANRLSNTLCKCSAEIVPLHQYRTVRIQRYR